MVEKKKNLVERLEALETQANRVVMVENLALNLKRSLTTVIEMLNALVEEMGGEDLASRIAQRLEDQRTQQRKADADRAKAVLDGLVAEGRVKAVETIGDTTVIVGLENSPDGKVKDERLQVNLAGLNPEVAAELKGKGVGYVVQREGKPVFTVQELYEMVPQEPVKLSEPPPEAPAPESTLAPEDSGPAAASAPAAEAPTPTEATAEVKA